MTIIIALYAIEQNYFVTVINSPQNCKDIIKNIACLILPVSSIFQLDFGTVTTVNKEIFNVQALTFLLDTKIKE